MGKNLLSELPSNSAVPPVLVQRQLVSIVIPCFNEEEVLPHLLEALKALGARIENDYRVEFVLVDDGSRDRTWEMIQVAAINDPRIKGLALSRNFGHQTALTCGYDFAGGDAVISMDADLQDPPEAVLEMLAKWRGGADIVYGVRVQRDGESWFKRATASLFYRLLRRMTSTNVREDSGDFRLMNRRSLDALKQMREYHRFIRGMVGWVGFQTAEVFYQRQARKAGQTKYPLIRMLRLAMDATVSFSFVPLRMAYYAAGLLTLGIFVYLGWALVQYMFYGATLVPGWTSLLLAVVAFGSMNLVCVGIIGEYIGRIYEESKHRPLYFLRGATTPLANQSSPAAPAVAALTSSPEPLAHGRANSPPER